MAHFLVSSAIFFSFLFWSQNARITYLYQSCVLTPFAILLFFCLVLSSIYCGDRQMRLHLSGESSTPGSFFFYLSMRTNTRISLLADFLPSCREELRRVCLGRYTATRPHVSWFYDHFLPERTCSVNPTSKPWHVPNPTLWGGLG